MLEKPSRMILVSGFTPFNGEKINPSWQIVKALPDVISGFRVKKLRVPTAFGESIKAVTNAIDKHHPQIVLCLGQAGGRTHMSVERVAINIDDAGIADNQGAWPIDQAIVQGAPAAYFCTLPIKAMVEAMRQKGVPAEVSNTAGTFVCNHLLYGVLHHIALLKPAQGKQPAAARYPMRAGFMHVPYADSQIVGREQLFSLPIAEMAIATKAAIMAAIKHRADIISLGGKQH